MGSKFCGRIFGEIWSGLPCSADGEICGESCDAGERGGVVRVVGAGRGVGLSAGESRGGAGRGRQIRGRDETGAVHQNFSVDDLGDGGFEAEVAGTAVQHGKIGAEILENHRGAGRAGAAGAVGAGRGERAVEGFQKFLGEGVGGAADGDERAARGRGVGDELGGRKIFGGVFWNFGEEEGQRAREKLREELLFEGVGGAGETRDSGRIGDVDDERVVLGAVFGRENLGDGARVACVGGEAVDGFGRDGDELARFEELGGSVEGDERHRGRSRKKFGKIFLGEKFGKFFGEIFWGNFCWEKF